MRAWSIRSKLVTITGVFAAVVVALVAAAAFASFLANGIRAYLSAEGQWSKGQKDAVFYLTRYASTLDGADFEKFRRAIAVPLSARRARVELEKPDFERAAVERAFLEGLSSAEEVPALIFLFRNFRDVEVFAAAVGIWAELDGQVAELEQAGDVLHRAIRAGTLTPELRGTLLDEIERINARLTPLESEFSKSITATARWARRTVIGTIVALAILLLVAGVAVAAWIASGISSGIRELHAGALKVAAGDLSHPLPVHSRDEIGELTAAFNRMVEQRRAAEAALRASHARVAAQKSAAAALLGATTLEQAAPGVLQAVCEAIGWDVGAIWLRDADDQALRCAEFWRPPDRTCAAFEAATRSMTLARGVGLPGRVWAGGSAVWIPDVLDEANFPRAPHAASDGLHAAFGFPIFGAGNEVLGVIEFFSREVLAPDDDLLKMMGTLGGLLGQFVGRKRAEAELAARVDELARSNEELERFAYVASHDLQEPLRTLGSYTQLLLRRIGGEGADPKVRDYAEYMTSAVRRMRELIDGLLSYSRVGRQELPPEPADLGGLLARALDNLKGAIDGSGARVEAGPLPTLRVDEAQVAQVFQNLVGNALKFRGATPPRVEVSAEAHGDEWVISVRDHGIGIEPQHFERVFGLFQRLHTQETYPGSGLGLAICKRIVERHGGRIWVEAARPGTVFRFALPAAAK